MSVREFRVGDIALNREVVTEGTIKGLKEAAGKTGVADGRKDVAEVADRWVQEGQITAEDFSSLYQFSKGVKNRYYELNGQFWKKVKEEGRSFKDPEVKALEAEMSKAAAYLERYEQLRDQLRMDTALAAVKAAAGASFSGPVGLIAAYEAWSQGAQWSGAADEATRKLLDTYQGYISGDSRMITQGNLVQQAHRERLWMAIQESLTLDEATRSARAGRPVEIDLQYYELTSPEVVGKAAVAAQAGNKLRINVDPGRLAYPETDEDKKKFFNVSDIPDKMRTVMQLAQVPGADVGVTIFPPMKELEDPENLMHRKVLRAGNTVLLSGMNANAGSGENLDAGYRIQGPAAARLVENFARDVKSSVGVGPEEIWGQEHFDMFLSEDLRVDARGAGALLDALGGPAPAGAELPRIRSAADLAALGKQAGVDAGKLFESGLEEAGQALARGQKVALSDFGKQKLVEVIQKAIEITQDGENLERAQDIGLPPEEEVGKTRVDIADLPPEREAMMLQAIAEAEEFIYIPGFIVTRAVAAALVARRDELKARGKEIDIRVAVDPGIYPDGGTPNYWGVAYLENHGINPRWAFLTRTGWHDRKIHAKQLITEKGEMSGSTNFSKKGLKDNWEESTFVHFDPEDKQALADRDQSVAQFNDLWKNEAIELTSRDLAAYWKRYKPAEGREWQLREAQEAAVKDIIGKIDEYERQSARWVESLAARPDIAPRIQELRAQGMAEGYATLIGIRNKIGDRSYYEGLYELPAYRELRELQRSINDWKAREGA